MLTFESKASLSSQKQLGDTTQLKQVRLPNKSHLQTSRQVIVAFKKGRKTQEVVLVKTFPQLGQKGDVKTVKHGFFSNYLLPQQIATQMTPEIKQQILLDIKQEGQRKVKARAESQSQATALKLINKFFITKRTAKDGETLYGSVSLGDIQDAVKKQTDINIPKELLNVPDIKKIGVYEITAQLHPDVMGKFNIVIQKEKQAQKTK